MKFLVLVICGCLGLAIAHAQTGTVTGKLTDTLHKREPGMATVQVRRAADSTLVTYRLANERGDFKVPGLPLNVPLRLTVTYTGYLPLRKVFTIHPDKTTLDLGKLDMETTTKQLDEVVVRSEAPPIVMRNDTMEFNADAFKTLPDAVLQDLLKKLPGVSFNAKGELMANGKKVNKILVDGKVFFGDDPSIALQNLPTNVIDKVQVTDDKEQKEELNGEHEEEVGKVINIKLKKSIKKGAFGKVYAGGGTDSRYEAGGIINSFRDTLQISALGFANNVNEAGFSVGDVRSMGGMERGENGANLWGDDYMQVSGVDIGSADNGIRTNKAGGVNINYDLGDKLSVNGKYFLGNTSNKTASHNNTRQLIGDTTLFNTGNSSGVRSNTSNGLSFKLAGKKDSTFNWRYVPSISFGSSDHNNLNDGFTSSNYAAQLNDQRTTSEGHSTFHSYRHSIVGTYNFKQKKGRSITFSQDLDTRTNDGRDSTTSLSHTYLTGEVVDLAQFKHSNQKTLNANQRLFYSEPLTKKITLTLTASAIYNSEDNVLRTYDRDTVEHKLSALDSAYSNENHRDAWTVNGQVGLRFKLAKSMSLNVSGQWQQQSVHSTFGPQFSPVDQRITNFIPGLSFNYKGFNVYYGRYVDLPSPSEIQPMPDISNPLYVTVGNPNLKPSVRDYVSAYYQAAKDDKSIWAYSSFSASSNETMRVSKVNADGSQVTSFINKDGIYRFYLSGEGTIGLHKTETWRLSLSAGADVNYGKSFVAVNSPVSGQTTLSTSPRAGLELNLKDVFELSTRFNLDYNRSMFELKSYQSQSTRVNRITTNMVVRPSKSLTFETNLVYRFNDALAPGISRNNYLWNASVSYMIGKDRRYQVKAAIFDILNQHNNLYRGVYLNYVSDYQSMVLQRYAMLSLIYNIRGFRPKS